MREEERGGWKKTERKERRKGGRKEGPLPKQEISLQSLVTRPQEKSSCLLLYLDSTFK